MPRQTDVGSQLQARIHRKADDHQKGPKRDGIDRVPQKGDDGHEYQYDQMHPGPLSDRAKYDPKNEGRPLPAGGFFGGKYDEHTLKEARRYYRIAQAKENNLSVLGRWFTEQPLQSETQLRIDAAVKHQWIDPKDASLTGKSPAEVCLTVTVPKGTKVYPGPVAGQSDMNLGGMTQKQVFIPDIRSTPGVKIDSIQPFKRDGHEQKPPAAAAASSAAEHTSKHGAGAPAPAGNSQGHQR
ncbi:MAG: hypothetical protein GIW94_09480 [Candidatus Eremiobacteraeota bacterium]|nr:hypothetical protein [Candidatus Eremiobacteraeota bacterium]